MSDFKDRMIEAVERGWTTEAEAYDYVRESYADAADRQRKWAREHPEEVEYAKREEADERDADIE